MKYSDIKVLETKGDHRTLYAICMRGKLNKKNGKFVRLYQTLLPFHAMLFRFATPELIADILSDDGEYMLIEHKDGDEHVILPNELKACLTLTEVFDAIKAYFKQRIDGLEIDAKEKNERRKTMRKFFSTLKKHLKQNANLPA